MIVARKLTKEYGDKLAVDDISFDIQDGLSFGLLGPNGAGKTTTIKMLACLLAPTSGVITIDGERMSRARNDIKKGMGLVSQHISLQREMTPSEALNLHGMLHKIKRKERKKRIEELLKFAGLYEDKNKLIGKLSGGNKRKLMIIRSVMHRPKILFLDEPTVGLDVSIRRAIWDLLKKLKDDGMTILLTTHYIEEARTLCDEIAMIMDGKIVAQDTPERFMQTVLPIVVESFDGEATAYEFFENRHEASIYAEKIGGTVVIRKTNLEDVYVMLTHTDLTKKEAK
jgi:ABC-2 type transport system ATP-binding protein